MQHNNMQLCDAASELHNIHSWQHRIAECLALSGPTISATTGANCIGTVATALLLIKSQTGSKCSWHPMNGCDAMLVW
jgi:hypothetical protein